MSRRRLEKLDPKYVRSSLNHAYDLVGEMRVKESALIQLLDEIDKQKLYVSYGYKSLMGFCVLGLKFSKTQAQRLVTQVRRTIPMSKIGVDRSHKWVEGVTALPSTHRRNKIKQTRIL